MTGPVIEFLDFKDENADEWMRFVETCDDAWLGHSPFYINAFNNEFSFSIRLNGALRGVCVLGSSPRRWGAYLEGVGMALAPEAHTQQVYEALKKKLKDLAVRAKCQAVEITLHPMAPANINRAFADTVLKRCGFSDGARWRRVWEIHGGFFSSIDLDQDLDAIVRGFSKGNKASVNRCKKLGFSVQIETGETAQRTAWDDFVAIHNHTYLRSGGQPYSQQRLELLFRLVQAGYLTLFTFRRDGICVASLVLSTFKRGAVYFAGGALDEARQQGIMAWAHAQAAHWLQQNGYKQYGIGFTIPALAETKDGAIGTAKKGFGGNKWPMLCGELVLRPVDFFLRQFLPGLIKFAIECCRTLTQSILKAPPRQVDAP